MCWIIIFHVHINIVIHIFLLLWPIRRIWNWITVTITTKSLTACYFMYWTIWWMPPCCTHNIIPCIPHKYISTCCPYYQPPLSTPLWRQTNASWLPKFWSYWVRKCFTCRPYIPSSNFTFLCCISNNWCHTWCKMFKCSDAPMCRIQGPYNW